MWHTTVRGFTSSHLQNAEALFAEISCRSTTSSEKAHTITNPSPSLCFFTWLVESEKDVPSTWRIGLRYRLVKRRNFAATCWRGLTILLQVCVCKWLLWDMHPPPTLEWKCPMDSQLGTGQLPEHWWLMWLISEETKSAFMWSCLESYIHWQNPWAVWSEGREDFLGFLDFLEVCFLCQIRAIFLHYLFK